MRKIKLKGCYKRKKKVYFNLLYYKCLIKKCKWDLRFIFWIESLKLKLLNEIMFREGYVNR